MFMKFQTYDQQIKVISNITFPYYLVCILENIPSGNYTFTTKKNEPSKITRVAELNIENGQILIEIMRLKSKIENLT